ncbi:MAG TPA: glycosyltransferase, partial [Firmicutes bacterium]|nr:glycosyltransferase [Bacillota bacterium]
MEKPIVIAILTLNNVELLKQCLESIFANTELPYRICVVNQASTDGTKEYLDSLAGRIDVIHSPKNLGFVGGNNLVMER